MGKETQESPQYMIEWSDAVACDCDFITHVIDFSV